MDEEVPIDKPRDIVEEEETPENADIPPPIEDEEKEIDYDNISYSNMPEEILFEITKFMDVNSLTNISLVNHLWFYAAQDNSYWRAEAVKVQQQLLTAETQRYNDIMNSYRYDIENPPERPTLRPIPETEADIPTTKSRFIIRKKRNIQQHGMLRIYVIDTRKRLKKEEEARILALKIKQKRENIFHRISTHRYRLSLVCATLIYIFFVCFFILMALRDVSPLLTDVYAYIPLWLMFLSALVLLCFFSTAYFILGERPIVILMTILIGVFIAGFVQSFLVIMNTSILPVQQSTDYPYYKKYTVSWFIIMIPAYLAIAGFWLGTLGLVIYEVRRKFCKKCSQPMKERWKSIFRCLCVFAVPNCLMASALLMAANGDYPALIHVAIDFAPLYPVEIVMIFVVLRWLIKEIRSTYRDKVLLSMIVCILLFFISLIINQVIVSLQEYLKRYVWFSSLLPLTFAYLFFFILCIEKVKNGM